jgi:AcrR family transcriptional regulator
MAHAKLQPAERKQQILQAALLLLKQQGVDALTRDRVAAEANVANGSVNVHFKTIDNLKDMVFEYAVATLDDEALARLVSIPKFKSRMRPQHVQLAINYLAS